MEIGSRYSSGFRAWKVNVGGTGPVTLETPVAHMEFYVRTRDIADGNTVTTAYVTLGTAIDSPLSIVSDDTIQLVTYSDIENID